MTQYIHSHGGSWQRGLMILAPGLANPAYPEVPCWYAGFADPGFVVAQNPTENSLFWMVMGNGPVSTLGIIVTLPLTP